MFNQISQPTQHSSSHLKYDREIFINLVDMENKVGKQSTLSAMHWNFPDDTDQHGNKFWLDIHLDRRTGRIIHDSYLWRAAFSNMSQRTRIYVEGHGLPGRDSISGSYIPIAIEEAKKGVAQRSRI